MDKEVNLPLHPFDVNVAKKATLTHVLSRPSYLAVLNKLQDI